MTLTLDLTPDVEEKLRRKATQRGQDLNDYAQSVLRIDADSAAIPADQEWPAPGDSLYDAMKDYIGMFQSDGETTWSENTGEKFTEALLEQKRRNRL